MIVFSKNLVVLHTKVTQVAYAALGQKIDSFDDDDEVLSFLIDVVDGGSSSKPSSSNHVFFVADSLFCQSLNIE